MQKFWLLGLAAVACVSALVAVLTLGPATSEDDANKAEVVPVQPVAQAETTVDEKEEPPVPVSAPISTPAPPLAQDEKPVDEIAETKPDLYAVPEGDTATLVKFIKDMQSMTPAVTSQLEIIEHYKKSTAAQIVAAERILAGEASDDDALVAVGAKIQSLMMRDSQLGVADAKEKLQTFMALVKNDSRPAVADIAFQFELVNRLTGWRQLSSNDKSAFIADVIAYLGKTELNDDRLQLAMFVVRQLKTFSETSHVVTLYEALIPTLKENANPEFAALAARFEGAVRNLTLVGNTMDIQGTMLDGSNFDWSAYEGKVVLVDFWATWCGPCIQELPNVVENYELYHDKGFDVVGISLDNLKTKVEKFVVDRELAWPILYSDDDTANGWQHPMATYYGITGIPAAILVDQQGKVVTLNARGPTLRKHLEELLGKVDEPISESEKAPEKRTASKGSNPS